MTPPSAAEQAAVASLTPRAQRTRGALLAAARTIFERDGFHNARITDIADEAKVAHGTFYTYFDSKESILLAIIDDVLDGLFARNKEERSTPQSSLSPYERLERANRTYLEVYRDSGRIIAIWEDLAAYNEEAASRLQAGLDEYVVRSERQIRKLQAQGLVDQTLDPEYAARALTGMVHRFAHLWFGRGESLDFETALRTLTQLWANALKLEAGTD